MVFVLGAEGSWLVMVYRVCLFFLSFWDTWGFLGLWIFWAQVWEHGAMASGKAVGWVSTT